MCLTRAFVDEVCLKRTNMYHLFPSAAHSPNMLSSIQSMRNICCLCFLPSLFLRRLCVQLHEFGGIRTERESEQHSDVTLWWQKLVPACLCMVSTFSLSTVRFSLLSPVLSFYNTLCVCSCCFPALVLLIFPLGFFLVTLCLMIFTSGSSSLFFCINSYSCSAVDQ